MLEMTAGRTASCEVSNMPLDDDTTATLAAITEQSRKVVSSFTVRSKNVHAPAES